MQVPTRDAHDRTAAEVAAEQLFVEGGGHEHQPYARLLGQQVTQHDQQEVRIAVALMNLIHKHMSHALQAVTGFDSGVRGLGFCSS